MKRIFGLALVGFLYVLLSAHELYLKADSYFLEANSPQSLYLFNGTFDESDNIISRDRVLKPQIIGPDFLFEPVDGDFYDKGKTTFLKFKTGDSGTYVAGVSTKPNDIEMDAKAFKDYLVHEGLWDVEIDRKNKGLSDKGAREKYSKHVKSILQVGTNKTEHYGKALNYPIEFIPLKNPYESPVGEEISFKLLYLGEALSGAIVHIGSKKSQGEKGEKRKSLQTDAEGRISFELAHPGQWYLSTIHMIESEEEDFDYESNWATLTFEIK